jgi:hypothetical protein
MLIIVSSKQLKYWKIGRSINDDNRKSFRTIHEFIMYVPYKMKANLIILDNVAFIDENTG